MAEWLYEKGLGENRALLLDGGRAVEAHLEVFPAPLQPGDVLSMRVIEIQVQGRRGIVRLSAPGDAPDTNPDFEAILEPLPERTSLKSEVLVEIVREPMFDGRVHKRAKARLAAPDAIPGGASALRDRIEATDHPIRTVDPHGPDLLEEAGWTVQDGVLKNAEGQTFAFEILITNGADDIIGAATIYVEALKRLGIEAKITSVVDK